jgi:hypothetical protein
MKDTAPSEYSFLRNNRNSVDLHQVIRMRQTRHEQESDQGRIRPVAPHTLKDFEGRLRWLSLYYVDVPLDDIIQLCPSGCQRVSRFLKIPYA